MKDRRGLYYYPFPRNKRVRMYVKEEAGEVFFRMWNTDDPQLWLDHGWVPHGAIIKAAAMYNNRNRFDPSQAYDIKIAQSLLKE